MEMLYLFEMKGNPLSRRFRENVTSVIGREVAYLGARMGAQNLLGRHYENMPIQIYWKFYHQKLKIFR